MFSALAEKQPQLVILDIMMPGEDGIGVLRRLRGDPKTKNIPVIMATAKGTEMDTIEALDLGADDYLIKPLIFYRVEISVYRVVCGDNRFGKRGVALYIRLDAVVDHFYR